MFWEAFRSAAADGDQDAVSGLMADQITTIYDGNVRQVNQISSSEFLGSFARPQPEFSHSALPFEGDGSIKSLIYPQDWAEFAQPGRSNPRAFHIESTVPPVGYASQYVFAQVDGSYRLVGFISYT